MNDFERKWLFLPTRFGGMGLIDPFDFSHMQHTGSKNFNELFVKQLLRKQTHLTAEILDEMSDAKKRF